jgi:hypothetical protein
LQYATAEWQSCTFIGSCVSVRHFQGVTKLLVPVTFMLRAIIKYW